MQNLLLHLGSPKSAAKVNRAQSAKECAVKSMRQQNVPQNHLRVVLKISSLKGTTFLRKIQRAMQQNVVSCRVMSCQEYIFLKLFYIFF